MLAFLSQNIGIQHYSQPRFFIHRVAAEKKDLENDNSKKLPPVQ